MTIVSKFRDILASQLAVDSKMVIVKTRSGSTLMALPAECEQLYSPEVANDPRFDKLSLRVRALEQTQGHQPTKAEVTEQFKNLIRGAVEDGLRTQSETTLARIKSWSPVGAIVAIVLFVLLQWNGYTIFRTHTEDRLGDIEAALRVTRAAQAPKAVFDEIANLDKKEFTKNLPALRATTEQPISMVSPTASAIYKISQQLSSTRDDTPEYWPTALRFLQFASSHLGSKAPAPGSLADAIMYTGNIVRNTSLIPPDETILLEGGSLENTELVRDRIIFTNKPVKMRNVRFVDCAFEFPGDLTPSRYLHQAARQLLASNLNSIKSLDTQ